MYDSSIAYNFNHFNTKDKKLYKYYCRYMIKIKKVTKIIKNWQIYCILGKNVIECSVV